jgi:hypothetical protein
MVDATPINNNNNFVNIQQNNAKPESFFKFFNSEEAIVDVIPNKMKVTNDKGKKISVIEDKTIFSKLSSKLTYYPSYILNCLLLSDDYKDLINIKSIYNAKITPVNTDFTSLVREYEPKFTVHKCDTSLGFTDLDETNQSDFYRLSLNAFFLDDKSNIFIGFIKLGPNIIGKAYTMFSNIKGHMNSFIIDKKQKLIIHFEPKGSAALMSVWCSFDLKKCILHCVNEEFRKEINDYTFINSQSLFKKDIMPQFFDIYCQTYSIYGALLYCLNQDYPRERKLELLSKINYSKAVQFQNYFYLNHSEKIFKTMQNNVSDMGAANERSNTLPPLMSSKIGNSNSNKNNSFELVNGGGKQKKSTKQKKLNNKHKHIHKTKKN